MNIDKNVLKCSITQWDENIRNYSLPDWEQLPVIDLYMDQVLSLIEQYLSMYYEINENKKFITASMINNYVKLNIIPSPKKKKYSKEHLAYLLIVCTLKQTLDMATIKKILPESNSGESIKELYSSFVRNQKKSYNYVSENVMKVANPIIENEGDNPSRMNDLILQVASSANAFKILSERITNLSSEEK